MGLRARPAVAIVLVAALPAGSVYAFVFAINAVGLLAQFLVGPGGDLICHVG